MAISRQTRDVIASNEALNAENIRALPVEDLADRLLPIVRAAGFPVDRPRPPRVLKGLGSKLATCQSIWVRMAPNGCRGKGHICVNAALLPFHGWDERVVLGLSVVCPRPGQAHRAHASSFRNL